MTTQHWELGIDLGQTALGLVAVPYAFWDGLDWSLVQSIAIGRSLGKDASPEDRGGLLVSQMLAVVGWVHTIGWGPPQAAYAEAYPMGPKKPWGIDRVMECGGAMRKLLWDEWELGMHQSPIATARKLLMGTLSKPYLAGLVSAAIADGLYTKAKAKSLGDQKAAVWGELHNMGAQLFGPDAGDAFVALNLGRYNRGQLCIAREAA